MRSKSILNLLFVVIIAASIVISLPVISFASTQAVNDAAANTKLTNIYNRLGNMYDRMAVTNTYLSNIQSYTSDSKTYLYNIQDRIIGYFGPITGDNKTIAQQLYDLRQATYAVGGQTADVSSKLLTTNNYLSSIDSKTVDRNYTQYIDGIENELTNISWTDRPINYAYYSSLADAVSQTNSISSAGSYSNIFVRIQFTNYEPYNDALYFEFPIIPSTSYSIPSNQMIIDNVYALANSNTSAILLSSDDIQFDFRSLQQSRSIYLDGIGRSLQGGANFASRTTFIFDVTSNGNVYIFPTDSSIAKSIPYLTEDYIKVSNYLELKKFGFINDNLQTLVDVYASPDVIAAKEQQQAYEDQTISDFTGSGSAAASGSDATNMKNVSGAIKSGLDSGGSVSNALSVFNTSGGLWDWFSQSNYDEINGPQTRGSGEYIDFYNTNREELERLLQEDNR